jgi:hypothetical protein
MGGTVNTYNFGSEFLIETTCLEELGVELRILH